MFRMKYCLFLLIFCSIIEAKAEDSNNPYDILLNVFSHKLNRSLNDCNLYLIPLVDEQMKIKKESRNISSLLMIKYINYSSKIAKIIKIKEFTFVSDLISKTWCGYQVNS